MSTPPTIAENSVKKRKSGKKKRQHATASENGGGRRFRTSFSAEQLDELECEFLKHAYLPADVRVGLSNRLDLSEKQVKIWFQNRRMKSKRGGHGQEHAEHHALKTKPVGKKSSKKARVESDKVEEDGEEVQQQQEASAEEEEEKYRLVIDDVVREKEPAPVPPPPPLTVTEPPPQPPASPPLATPPPTTTSATASPLQIIQQSIAAEHEEQQRKRQKLATTTPLPPPAPSKPPVTTEHPPPDPCIPALPNPSNRPPQIPIDAPRPQFQAERPKITAPNVPTVKPPPRSAPSIVRPQALPAAPRPEASIFPSYRRNTSAPPYYAMPPQQQHHQFPQQQQQQQYSSAFQQRPTMHHQSPYALPDSELHGPTMMQAASDVDSACLVRNSLQWLADNLYAGY